MSCAGGNCNWKVSLTEKNLVCSRDRNKFVHLSTVSEDQNGEMRFMEVARGQITLEGHRY